MQKNNNIMMCLYKGVYVSSVHGFIIHECMTALYMEVPLVHSRCCIILSIFALSMFFSLKSKGYFSRSTHVVQHQK